VEQLVVPEGALAALGRLGGTFLIDGERLEGSLAGTYVAFDLLEWGGEDLRPLPYRERIARLETALRDAGALASGAPTLARAAAAAQVPGFALLVPATTPEEKRAVLAEVRAAGGEGIIVRTLAGPSEPGDTRHERKHKLQASMDVLAIGIKPGIGSGSVRMGLIRPDDGATIEVGTVRNGLTERDLARISSALRQGERPVLEVTFLPARTVGIALVEPTARLRTDKAAAECSTAQYAEVFGGARDALLAAAPAALGSGA
jgi:ATP-dependent DNA ligase